MVPYAAGDGLDLSCRAMLDNIDLPVNTLVENISGGSGTIGLQDALTGRGRLYRGHPVQRPHLLSPAERHPGL